MRYVDRIAVVSEEAADLTAATVFSMASPTASFSAFSWYSNCQYANASYNSYSIVGLQITIHGRPIALRIL